MLIRQQPIPDQGLGTVLAPDPFGPANYELQCRHPMFG
jgi:hypothetical protein